MHCFGGRQQLAVVWFVIKSSLYGLMQSHPISFQIHGFRRPSLWVVGLVSMGQVPPTTLMLQACHKKPGQPNGSLLNLYQWKECMRNSYSFILDKSFDLSNYKIPTQGGQIWVVHHGGGEDL